MENNILTAKEWYYSKYALGGDDAKSIPFNLFEDYASYKTKVLEDRILKFREKLLKIALDKVGYVFDSNDNLYVKYDDFVYKHQTNIINGDLTLNEFDKHFNITTE